MDKPSKRPKVLQNCHYRVLRGHPVLGTSSPPLPWHHKLSRTRIPFVFKSVFALEQDTHPHQDSHRLLLCPQHMNLPILPHLLSKETSNETVLNITWDKVSWKKPGVLRGGSVPPCLHFPWEMQEPVARSAKAREPGVKPSFPGDTEMCLWLQGDGTNQNSEPHTRVGALLSQHRGRITWNSHFQQLLHKVWLRTLAL